MSLVPQNIGDAALIEVLTFLDMIVILLAQIAVCGLRLAGMRGTVENIQSGVDSTISSLWGGQFLPAAAFQAAAPPLCFLTIWWPAGP